MKNTQEKASLEKLQMLENKKKIRTNRFYGMKLDKLKTFP